MNVIITGASRGIGLELTAQALKKNCHVMAVARAPEKSRGLRSLAKDFGNALDVVVADVTDPEAPQRIAAAAKSWPCVDLLINNAGIYNTATTRDALTESFATNATAPFLVARELVPHLKSAKNPKLVQVTSVMGSICGNTSGGSYGYRASKAALNMLTKTIAEDEEWLTAIVIHPGWVRTDMGGAGAPVEARDSAAGIWRVIDDLTKSESGQFFDFEGNILPW